MSPAQGAEALAMASVMTLVVAVDHAEDRAALTGRETADAADDLDSVARRLGGGDPAGGNAAGGAAAGGEWSGRSGGQARRRVGDAAAEARMLSGACLFLSDVLRVEGSRLARALIHWSDDARVGRASGDTTEVQVQVQVQVEAEVEDADRGLVARLREAADSLAGYTDAATRACLDLAGSTDDDPRAIAEQWHSLAPADRERLARDHPELGSVAGLSSATRDALNRTRLRRLLDAGGTGAGGAGPDEAVAPGLAALAAHLAEDPRRHLLSLHADGRAVVASDDPDGADRVVTLIPGTGASLGSIDRTAERAAALCEADDAATGSCVAVSWQGYLAPADAVAAGFSAAPARAHAGDLRDFSAGLDAVESMDGHDAPHAAVGYSYGSAVLGAAAADPHGLAADRMIHVGSPGATVDSLAEQWTDEAGTARPARPDEVVGVVSRWDPVPWWSITEVLGGRPGTEEFGGFAVDVTEPDAQPAQGVPGLDQVRGAHSAYFDPGTVSLEEIGRLVAGTD
ncbi:alpha/beta hydrolase [Rhodococcus sp. IEGM 1408]|uniref:alpha/beta hydrolase n=1 Tax=Rhodococcus sp. IEGM 1408 TaxID=3082220 RepID=UPI00295520CB|nr:alpha/beta hydrolase [Rhodococcus sp. IEGM 1408]MDV8001651.1 alpha/beta hydrolase [Rhodococcus sp. IEGM 1408]